MSHQTATPPTRRARARDATTAEIKATARARLVAAGPEAVTLRAIARDIGMTAPALYRYFGNHEELIGAVCGDIFDEITAELEQARDSVTPDQPVARLGATCRAFRRWSLAHRQEFQLLFASVGYNKAPADGGTLADLSFGAVFLDLFVEIWKAQPFAVPPDDQIPAGLAAQLARFSAYAGDVLPLGALAAYLAGWVRLYGAVTVEVFGHLGFALSDPEPMFEAMLADMARPLSTPTP